MKPKLIGYWAVTIIAAAELLAGAEWDLTRRPDVVQLVTRLGYPGYVLMILGFWKVLGAIAILAPGFPRLKEWAYAGIFFDLTGAAVSCAWVGGYGAYGFHVIAPLFIAGFTVASWALRPESRTIGILFPAKGGRSA